MFSQRKSLIIGGLLLGLPALVVGYFLGYSGSFTAMVEPPYKLWNVALLVVATLGILVIYLGIAFGKRS